jgi:hypothetical protein
MAVLVFFDREAAETVRDQHALRVANLRLTPEV